MYIQEMREVTSKQQDIDVSMNFEVTGEVRAIDLYLFFDSLSVKQLCF